MSAITSTCEGNLTADPVLRTTNSGLPVANFRIAVSRRQRVSSGEYVETTEYINVVAWRNLATNLVNSVSKGDRVIVSGDLRQRQWEDRDGNKRYTTEIQAEMVGVSLRFHIAGPVKASEVASMPESDEHVPSDDEIYA